MLMDSGIKLRLNQPSLVKIKVWEDLPTSTLLGIRKLISDHSKRKMAPRTHQNFLAHQRMAESFSSGTKISRTLALLSHLGLDPCLLSIGKQFTMTTIGI